MKKWHKKLFISIVILLASFLILPNNVFSAVPQPNFVMALGTFDYVQYATYGELSFTLGNVNSVVHADGSIWLYPSCYFFPNCTVDVIYDGTVTFSTFVNSVDTGGGENWIFTPSDPTGTEFTVEDANTVTRLTADIWQFTVNKTPDGSGGFLYEVNAGFNEGNVGPITTYSGATSEFIDDVNSFSPPWGELYMKFNFTGSGPHDFTQSESGTITGTFAVTPEPVSSILFISGGATLAFRRYLRKSNKNS